MGVTSLGKVVGERKDLLHGNAMCVPYTRAAVAAPPSRRSAHRSCARKKDAAICGYFNTVEEIRGRKRNVTEAKRQSCRGTPELGAGRRRWTACLHLTGFHGDLKVQSMPSERMQFHNNRDVRKTLSEAVAYPQPRSAWVS